MMNSMTISHSKDDNGPVWTLTTEGFIRGKKIAGVVCVVKTEIVGNDRDLPRPKRTKEGHLIFAIPGGGGFAAGEFLD